MPLSKFEANLMLRLPVRHTPLFLFPLVSLCSNNYFSAYAIIDYLDNQLTFPNVVTYVACFEKIDHVFLN